MLCLSLGCRYVDSVSGISLVHVYVTLIPITYGCFTTLSSCIFFSNPISPVSSGYRIRQLLPRNGVNPTPCLEYDIKPSDGKAPALVIWRMLSTPSLLFLPGPLWPGVVVPDRVLSRGQIEQTMCANKWLISNCDCYIAILETIYLCAKKSWGSFKNVIYKMCLQILNI